MSAGLCSSFIVPSVMIDVIDHARRGGDQIEIEFALQPLAHDLQMQQAEKAAAKAEAQRGGGFGFIGEAGIVEMQLAQRVAQILELRRVDREQAAEHHLLRRLEAGQGVGVPLRSSVMVSPTWVSATCLIWAVMKPTSPGPSLSTGTFLGVKTPICST